MKIFGLIGFPLGHSFSKKYFTDKFRKEGFHDCVYENYEIDTLQELPALLDRYPAIHGLNVTIPYKERVIPFLHSKNEVVSETGACNCIKIVKDKLYGYNTDTIGFEQSLTNKLQSFHTKALVLGTGGSAKAIRYVLEKLNIEYLNVTRKDRQDPRHLLYEEISDSILQEYTLIINTTPVGMYPNVNASPPLNYRQLSSRHYLFDLIYNPVKTLFLQLGEENGAITENGQDMLIIQAEESWKFWNDETV